jgi:signal transduction histidine kinase/ABC-type uncharacterized transport system substrate-binding protein
VRDDSLAAFASKTLHALSWCSLDGAQAVSLTSIALVAAGLFTAQAQSLARASVAQVIVAIVAVSSVANGLPGQALSFTGEPERPWAIVTLNDNDLTYAGTAAVDSALRKALTEPGRHPVDMFSASLDAFRFPLAQIESETVALLAKKYATMHIDAVVALGAAALDFAEKHRSRIWPDARILFQVVPVEKLANRPLSSTTTGIPTKNDVAGAVELAMALRPSTRRLVVIYGSGDFDRAMGDIARKQLERFSQRLNTEYWTDASIDEVLRRIAQLDTNDAVLYLTITRDADGRTFIPTNMVEPLAAASPAPIYAPFEPYIGHGVVAGSVYSAEARGKRMADLVQEALSAPTKSIPLVTMTSSCMADASQLKRFGMAESSLPPGCDIRFREFSVWHHYRWYIVAALVAIVLQSLLILSLLIQWRRRRIAEAESQKRFAEMAHMNRRVSMGELSASIAHELNQPLGAIHNNAGAAEILIKADPPKLQEVAEILADIKRDDRRASDVIARVRKMMRKTEFEVQPLDLNEAISEAIEMVAADARVKGVLLKADLEPGLPKVKADRVELQQVILNLVFNATEALHGQHTQRREVVIRSTRINNKRAEVSVADSGPGIAPEMLNRIFEPFVTTTNSGMGLGLTISRTIVEAHGGQIRAENSPQGGAVFLFTLPFVLSTDA